MAKDFKDIEDYFAARRAFEVATDNLALLVVNPNEAWLNIELPKFSDEFISAIVRRNGGGNGWCYTVSVIYEDRGTAKVIHVELGRDDPNNHVDAIVDAINAALSKKQAAEASLNEAIKEAMMTMNEARAFTGKGAL